jgi:hypothetical protein
LRALNIEGESESLETSRIFERLQRSEIFYKSSSELMSENICSKRLVGQRVLIDL